MLQKTTLFGLALLFVAFFFACSKNETEQFPKYGLEYYPVEVGKNWFYAVDSIVYDTIPSQGLVQKDTFHFQLWERIIDTFRTNNGLLTYKIERQKRQDSTQAWAVTDVYSTRIDNDVIIRTEQALNFIKMPVAFITSTLFDANKYVSPNTVINIAGDVLEPYSKTWDYEVKEIGVAETIGGKNYSNLTVIEGQTPPEIKIEKRYNLEKYALGIGLVYKELWILDTQALNDTRPWEQKARKGYILKQTLLLHN